MISGDVFARIIARLSIERTARREAFLKVGGRPYRTIWVEPDGWSIGIIDQTKLPHEFRTVSLKSVREVERAIRDMLVRGAPLIGATGAYGLCLAIIADPGDAALDS